MKTELSQKLESKMLERLIVNSYSSSCYHFSASRPRLLSTQTTLGKKVCCLGRKAHVTLCFQRKNRSPESSYGSPSV